MVRWDVTLGKLVFKGFYPGWWPLFIPGISQALYLRVLLAVHYLAAGIIAVCHANRQFEGQIALPLAAVSVFPMAFFNSHISKTLAWPFMILGAWALVDLYGGAERDVSRRVGISVGVAGGAMLLLANAYFAFYLAILAGCVFLASRAWVATRTAAVSSVLVGAPKLISLIPVLLAGGRDARGGYILTPAQLISGLTGLWWDNGLVFDQVVNFEAYAVVGLPVCLFAVAAVGYAYLYPRQVDTRWIQGVLVAGIFGVLLATQYKGIYAIPGVSIFRTARRAMILLGVGALLLAVAYLLVQDNTASKRRTQVLTALLVLSAAQGAIHPLSQSGQAAVEPTVGPKVAEKITSAGCERVWLENGYNGSRLQYRKEIGFALAERGVPVTAINYAKIGQEYRVRNDSKLTFDALVFPEGTELPDNETVTLEGGWGYPDRGTINASRFDVLTKVDTPAGELRIYAVDGRCE